LFRQIRNGLISICSIEKISKVTAPVLVIHGTEDEVISFSHGVNMYNQCSQPVEPLWVEGKHQDLTMLLKVKLKN